MRVLFEKYLGFFFLILTFGLFSCQSSPSLEDANFNMEALNFKNFNAKKYYAKSMKVKWSEFHDQMEAGKSPIYFFESTADTIDASGSDFRRKEAFAITYKVTGTGGMNTWAKDFRLSYFKNLNFVELTAITDMDNNLLMLASASQKLKKTDIANFIEAMDKQYGKAKLNVKPSDFRDAEIRKWILNDRVITLASLGNYHVSDDKFLTTAEKDYIAKQIQSDKTSASLYITKKNFDDLFIKMTTKIGILTNFE
ncbi:hypothetical protein [Soonwooa sp.]|uniref:hypothetical protein n=1 Tax=Soonwooa sp. TaxID=1938592 RepID=UPI002628ED62|nr:hypothetical protein [Soonwooa sp.]